MAAGNFGDSSWARGTVTRVDARRVVEALEGAGATPPCARRPAVTGGAPAEPGLYAWWARRGAIPALDATPGVTSDLRLFYVGIAPARDTSPATIRSRVVGQHLGGNIGGSTFRLSLTALLWEEQGWRPCWRGDRAQLPAEDNAALSVWQNEHLQVTWAVRARPWEVEGEVIAAMEPPLNLAANAAHPFHATLTAARSRLREHARRNPC